MAAKINDTSHMQNLSMVGLKNINKSMGENFFSCFKKSQQNLLVSQKFMNCFHIKLSNNNKKKSFINKYLMVPKVVGYFSLQILLHFWQKWKNIFSTENGTENRYFLESDRFSPFLHLSTPRKSKISKV